MKKQVWCKGAGRGANDRGGCTFCGYLGKPTKYWVVRPHLDRRWVNGDPPFTTAKPDDEVDDLRLGPNEVNYRCPRCSTAAPWTDGIEHGGNTPAEFWCQTCGAETPLEDCEVVPR